MHNRRSRSDPGDAAKDNDASVDEVESVSDSESSVHTVDLYRGWRIPDLNFSMRIPAWIVILATLLLFKGPSMPPLCVA
jgi:hypothetical protein